MPHGSDELLSIPLVTYGSNDVTITILKDSVLKDEVLIHLVYLSTKYAREEVNKIDPVETGLVWAVNASSALLYAELGQTVLQKICSAFINLFVTHNVAEEFMKLLFAKDYEGLHQFIKKRNLPIQKYLLPAFFSALPLLTASLPKPNTWPDAFLNPWYTVPVALLTIFSNTFMHTRIMIILKNIFFKPKLDERINDEIQELQMALAKLEENVAKQFECKRLGYRIELPPSLKYMPTLLVEDGKLFLDIPPVPYQSSFEDVSKAKIKVRKPSGHIFEITPEQLLSDIKNVAYVYPTKQQKIYSERFLLVEKMSRLMLGVIGAFLSICGIAGYFASTYINTNFAPDQCPWWMEKGFFPAIQYIFTSFAIGCLGVLIVYFCGRFYQALVDMFFDLIKGDFRLSTNYKRHAVAFTLLMPLIAWISYESASGATSTILTYIPPSHFRTYLLVCAVLSCIFNFKNMQEWLMNHSKKKAAASGSVDDDDRTFARLVILIETLIGYLERLKKEYLKPTEDEIRTNAKPNGAVNEKSAAQTRNNQAETPKGISSLAGKQFKEWAHNGHAPVSERGNPDIEKGGITNKERFEEPSSGWCTVS